MPIEFRCQKCGKLLRTGDETAGKQAKCPECGSIMSIPIPEPQQPEPSIPPPIPAALSGNPFGSFTSPLQQPETFNPYQAPTSGGYGSDALSASVPEQIVPTH